MHPHVLCAETIFGVTYGTHPVAEIVFARGRSINKSLDFLMAGTLRGVAMLVSRAFLNNDGGLILRFWLLSVLGAVSLICDWCCSCRRWPVRLDPDTHSGVGPPLTVNEAVAIFDLAITSFAGMFLLDSDRCRRLSDGGGALLPIPRGRFRLDGI